MRGWNHDKGLSSNLLDAYSYPDSHISAPPPWINLHTDRELAVDLRDTLGLLPYLPTSEYNCEARQITKPYEPTQNFGTKGGIFMNDQSY